MKWVRNILIALGLLTSFGFGAPLAINEARIAVLPKHEKLKAPSEKVIEAATVTQYDYDKGEKIPNSGRDVIRYAYERGDLVDLPDEVITLRTENTRTVKRGDEYVLTAKAGGPFQKEIGGTWKEIGIATTTPEAFALQTVSFFGQKALADTFSVGAAADDATERSDNTNFDSTRVEFAGRSGAAGNPYWYSGQRFANIPIPNATTITSATASFDSIATETNNAITDNIYANDVDNAANFTTTADIVDRVLTTATVAWAIPTSLTLDSTYTSGDIKTVIQEIVDRAGWASGNAIMIIHRPNAATAGQDASYYIYENDTAQVSTLVITYPVASTDGGTTVLFE